MRLSGICKYLFVVPTNRERVSFSLTRESKGENARLAHSDERRDPLPRNKVIHDVRAHLGRLCKETEKLGVVSLAHGEADGERVRDRVVARFFGRQLCESCVEFCAERRQASARWSAQ